MFRKLIQWFQKSQTQSDLERFIISKNPTNAADVDHWTREYQNKNYIWHRGF